MPTFGIPSVSEPFDRFLAEGLEKVEDLLFSQMQGRYPFAVETSRHLISAGGKRLRPLMTLISSQLGDPTKPGIIESAVVCELTHLATLYHDDVMDEAPLRRGVESANSLWGNTVAILTGDYLMAKAAALLADLGSESVRLQAYTFERLVIGQFMEMQGPSPGEDPVQHYLQVVADKTGSLIAASAHFGAMFSGAEADVIKTVSTFGEQIGVAFQLADDIIDITSTSQDSGKTPGTDLRAGVPTLVTLNVLRSTDPADRDLQQLLKAPIESDQLIEQVLAQLRSHKALDDARTQLLQVGQKARLALGPLPISEATTALFSLCESVVARSH